ncbi:MAG TPA: GtrA family protein [Tenericutes bacterium]|nr:GtrA family protein [Mycoplasmatota bacterium]
MKKLFKQIIKFGIVGGIAFVIDYSLLFILTDFFKIHYLISSIISFVVSFIFNYILSIKWVFDVNKKQTYKEIALFIGLSLIGLLINQIVLYITTDYLKVYYMISKIIATIIVMIWNFVTRKIFIED